MYLATDLFGLKINGDDFNALLSAFRISSIDNLDVSRMLFTDINTRFYLWRCYLEVPFYTWQIQLK